MIFLLNNNSLVDQDFLAEYENKDVNIIDIVYKFKAKQDLRSIMTKMLEGEG